MTHEFTLKINNYLKIKHFLNKTNNRFFFNYYKNKKEYIILNKVIDINFQHRNLKIKIISYLLIG